jgi:hypothetical protein
VSILAVLDSYIHPKPGFNVDGNLDIIPFVQTHINGFIPSFFPSNCLFYTLIHIVITFHFANQNQSLLRTSNLLLGDCLLFTILSIQFRDILLPAWALAKLSRPCSSLRCHLGSGFKLSATGRPVREGKAETLKLHCVGVPV